jgi:NitT/TauT family transport system permease protein
MTGTTGSHLETSHDAPLSIEEVEARVQDRRVRRRSRARISAVIYPVLTVVGTLVAWEFATRAFGIPAYLLPAPSRIAVSLVENAALILKHGWVTTIEIVLGFLLSIVVGVPLALAIFMWPAFSRSVLPLLVSSQAMPKVAVAPLFLVWFGFGLLPKVLIAFLIAFFPIVIGTAVGLASIEQEKIHLARSMGLGYLLMVANGNIDTPLLFAGLVALTVQGVVLFFLVELVERLAIPRQTAAAVAGLA